MKKILIASFCLALLVPAVQAQNVVTGTNKTQGALSQNSSKSNNAGHGERRHGTNGMANYGTNGMANSNRSNMGKSQKSPIENKQVDLKSSKTNMSTTPNR